jgi:hypothetical protein
MVTLQPRLPGRKKLKHEGKKEGGTRDRQPEAVKPESKEPRNARVIYGAAALVVVVVVLAVVVMVYSAPPPSAGNVLTDSQVRAELARLREISTYPENMNIRPADYPRVFGTWNNRTLVEVYFCSDVCPDYGRVDLVFQGVGPEQCGSIGGRELRDLAWGGYIGCGPRVE